SFSPILTKNNPCLDGLAKPHLVRKDNSFRQRRVQSEERGFNLVRIEINSRVEKRHGQTIQSSGGSPGEIVGEILRVVVCQFHGQIEPTILSRNTLNRKLLTQAHRPDKRVALRFAKPTATQWYSCNLKET